MTFGTYGGGVYSPLGTTWPEYQQIMAGNASTRAYWDAKKAGRDPNVPAPLPGLPGMGPNNQGALPTKPAIPSPFETQREATQSNLANLPDFSKLYQGLGSLIVGGDYPALQSQEYSNIADMMRGEPNMRSRNEGAWAAARSGVGGSPAGTLIDLFESDAQKRARQIAGSQLLSNAVGRQPLPVAPWQISPDANQYWQYLAAQRNAAAEPSAAYNLAAQAMAAGLGAGRASQRPVSYGTGNVFSGFTPQTASASPVSSPRYPSPVPNAPTPSGGSYTPTLPDYNSWFYDPNYVGAGVPAYDVVPDVGPFQTVPMGNENAYGFNPDELPYDMFRGGFA